MKFPKEQDQSEEEEEKLVFSFLDAEPKSEPEESPREKGLESRTVKSFKPCYFNDVGKQVSFSSQDKASGFMCV